MKRAELYFLIIMVGTFASFAILISYSLVQVTPEMPPTAIAGSKTWQEYGCMECHALLSSGGYAAIDLTKYMSNHTEKELLNFFEEPPPLPPHKKRIHVGLTKKEAVQISDFLRFVNKIDTRNWPPSPVIEGSVYKKEQHR